MLQQKKQNPPPRNFWLVFRDAIFFKFMCVFCSYSCSHFQSKNHPPLPPPMLKKTEMTFLMREYEAHHKILMRPYERAPLIPI